MTSRRSSSSARWRRRLLAALFAPAWIILTAPSLAAEGHSTATLTERFIANAAGFEISEQNAKGVQRAAATSAHADSIFEAEADYGSPACPHCGGAHSEREHQGPHAPPGPYAHGAPGYMDEGAAAGTSHFLPRSWDELVNGSVRHKGLGVPLLRESWNYRPWHVDWFAGVMWGDSITKYQVERGGGAIGGFRLGEDWGNYLGWETRFAFASLDMNNTGGNNWLDDTEDFYWDTSVMYYPWGDSLWRPYFSIGLGLARFQFYNTAGARTDESSFSLPLGVGLKYRYASWLAFRLDFTDNASFAGGLPWMNSYSLTAGMEFHFGGRRRSYQAWNPGRSMW